MAFLFTTFLFSILAFAPCFTLATLNPKVAFTVTPSTIEIATSTLARCTISGLDTAKYSSFSVDFFIKPSSGSVNNTALSFASWSTTNASAQGNYTQVPSALRYDLATNAGPSGIYPNYEVMLHPLNVNATGAYWCLLQLETSPNVTPAFASNQISTSPPVSEASLTMVTKAPLTPPYYYLGSPFSALCSVTSHQPLTFYTVSYYFSQLDKDTSKKLALFTISGGNSANLTTIEPAYEDLGWSLTAGSVALPGSFELRVKTSDKLVGGWFFCSVAVHKSEADPSGREYYSEPGMLAVKIPINSAGSNRNAVGTLIGALLLFLLIVTF